MNLKEVNILLADDDTDDCIFFKQALEELPFPTHLTTVHHGEQLMQLILSEKYELPNVIFLDLNMPRKNGFECLEEIKHSEKLKMLPIIIYSTSFEQGVVNLLYKNGAQYFIRKPSEFSQFKKIIQQAVSIIATNLPIDQTEEIPITTRENFVLVAENN